MEYLKKTWAEIDLDALEHNYRAIRAAVPETTRFAGVVKADAYGHGAVPVSRHLQELGTDYFAVSSLDEAIQLRRGGIDRPILVLGHTPPEYAIELTLLDLQQEVHSLEYAVQLSKALPRGQELKIHLKLDTGMSRLGFQAYDRPETIEELVKIASLEHLKITGCLQHFAVADSAGEEDQAFTQLQHARFMALVQQLRERGIDPGICHCANSAAVLERPDYAMDMIRPGILTYGLNPSDDCAGKLSLKPVLSWRTTIGQIRELDAGTAVSYGRTWVTARRSRIAVLSVGYGDGLSRALSGQLEVLVHGIRVSIVGRICMDLCMADVTDVPEASVGDTVTIIGRDGENEITANELAEKRGTIPYEILCAINKRIPRFYYKDGAVTEELRYIV